MCGIVGIVEQDPSRPVAPQDLERMVRMLHHRGPDEEGSITLPGVGLGMRRLAIVDLATGQQPILNETGDIKVVANGEIYNFHELQRELESHGHRFRSRNSDIEVLVHAYEQWGESFLERLRGMFALAIWDGRTRTLIAARDRAGEKPLYWTETPRGLLLASEVKALLVRPDVSRELDPIALDQFLTYEYVLAPRTMLQGVHKLPPAHFLRYRGGQATVHRYWDAADVAVKEWKDDDAAEALRAALRKAVDRQLMADVPLGAFLSGGIDSSSIVALMSEASSQPVNSFSIGFADGTYNELPYKFEAGTPPIAGAIGLGEALDYISGFRHEDVVEHEQDLLAYGEAALLSVPKLRIIGTAKEKTGLHSFVIDGVHPHDAAERLGLHLVAKAGDHRPALRDCCLHARQFQGRAVALLRIPHFGDPQRVGLTGIPGDDVAQAAGHAAGAVEQNGCKLVALAGSRHHLAD